MDGELMRATIFLLCLPFLGSAQILGPILYGANSAKVFTFTAFATSATCPGSPCTTTAANMGTGGGHLFGLRYAGDQAATSAVVTDSTGANSGLWTTPVCGAAFGGANHRSCLSWCINCTASASQTFTVTQAAMAGSNVQVVGATGATGTTAVDGTLGATFGEANGGGVQTVCLSGGTCPGSSITPSVGNALVMTFFDCATSANFQSIDNNGVGGLWSTPTIGTSSLINFNSGNNPAAAASYWLQGASPAAVNPKWTGTVVGGNFYIAAMVAFKP